jgi:hypothetical protein
VSTKLLHTPPEDSLGYATFDNQFWARQRSPLPGLLSPPSGDLSVVTTE